MSKLLNINGKIQTKPEGLDYDLINGKVYDFLYDEYNDYPFLKENGSLNMPKKLYEMKEDNNFIKRVLKYFNSDISSETTGVLLSGLKGCGKTILAKRIALESNLPIIIISTQTPIRTLTDFFKKVDTPVCIILDEFEKNGRYWPTDKMLGFLDGVQATTKKIVIMTCNNEDELDTNLIDRCSRIRYHRVYKNDSNKAFIEEIAKDKGIENYKEISKYIENTVEILSFDNINAILDDYLLFKDEYSIEEIVKEMNITTIHNF